MIQSSYKPIELPKADASEQLKSSAANSKNQKGISEGEMNEFSEVLAIEAQDQETKVQAVVVNPELELPLPSDFVEAEAVGPKLFESPLTQDVQKLLKPETTQVEVADEVSIQLAQGEIPKEEQNAKVSRSPAIEFTESEIDSELLKMEDFVAQKNLVRHKILPQTVYGVNPQLTKMQAEVEVKSTPAQQTEIEPVNSQQFILGLMSEQKSDSSLEAPAAPVKTFDMSQVKTENPDKIMSQITDYIVQAKAAKEPTVSMRVNHEDLGLIDITVAKSGKMNAEAVAVNIGTHSHDGKMFFQQNAKELLTHLTNTGLNVSDMKLEIPSQNSSKSEFDLAHSGKHNQGQDRQFGSERNQQRHDSQRREELWKLLNKEAA